MMDYVSICHGKPTTPPYMGVHESSKQTINMPWHAHNAHMPKVSLTSSTLHFGILSVASQKKPKRSNKRKAQPPPQVAMVTVLA